MGGAQSTATTSYVSIDDAIQPLRMIATINYDDDSEFVKELLYEKGDGRPLSVAVDFDAVYQMTTEMKVDPNIDGIHINAVLAPEYTPFSEEEIKTLTLEKITALGTVVNIRHLPRATYSDGFLKSESEKVCPRLKGYEAGSENYIIIAFTDDSGKVFCFFAMLYKVAQRLTKDQIERVQKFQKFRFLREFDDIEQTIHRIEASMSPECELAYLEAAGEAYKEELQRLKILGMYTDKCEDAIFHKCVEMMKFDGPQFILHAKDTRWRPLLSFYLHHVINSDLDLIKNRQMQIEKMKQGKKYSTDRISLADKCSIVLTPRKIDVKTYEWVLKNEALNLNDLKKIFVKCCKFVEMKPTTENLSADIIKTVDGSCIYSLEIVHKGNYEYVVHVKNDSKTITWFGKLVTSLSTEPTEEEIKQEGRFASMIKHMHLELWIRWLKFHLKDETALKKANLNPETSNL